MEHTKEPWRTASRITPRTEMYAQEIFDTDGETIAALSWYPVKKNNHTTATNREANARRIVACVNACARIPIEAIEEAAQMPDGFSTLAAVYAKQRDEVIEALESVLSGYETGIVHGFDNPCKCQVCEARAIIDRIKNDCAFRYCMVI